MGAEAENYCYEGSPSLLTQADSFSGSIDFTPPSMDMEFSFWVELIFGIGFTLGSIRDAVVRTSL